MRVTRHQYLMMCYPPPIPWSWHAPLCRNMQCGTYNTASKSLPEVAIWWWCWPARRPGLYIHRSPRSLKRLKFNQMSVAFWHSAFWFSISVSWLSATIKPSWETRCLFLSEIIKASQSSLFYVQATAGRHLRAQAKAVANELKNQEHGLGVAKATMILIVVSSRMLDANGLGLMGTMYSTT